MNSFKLSVVLLAFVSSAAFAADEAKFQTSCRVTLTSADQIQHRESKSLVFTADQEGLEMSWAEMQLGPYTLVAGFSMRALRGDQSPAPELIPTFDMNLFNGNPVTGQINYVNQQGFVFEKWKMGDRATLAGSNFLKFEYKGSEVTNILYICRIDRVL